MEIIASIVFVQENDKISSKSDFDIKYFKGNKALAEKIVEGLHFDFLHRMQEEELVTYTLPKDS